MSYPSEFLVSLLTDDADAREKTFTFYCANVIVAFVRCESFREFVYISPL